MPVWRRGRLAPLALGGLRGVPPRLCGRRRALFTLASLFPSALPCAQVQRCTYRRRKSFATASNAVRKVKTPGGELVLHYMGKKGNGPACGDCKKRLQGVRLPSLCHPSALAGAPMLCSLPMPRRRTRGSRRLR